MSELVCVNGHDRCNGISDPSCPYCERRAARPLKIRERHRQGYSKEAGGYAAWKEWQVVDGRKVIGRFDFRAQAERFIEERELAEAEERRDAA